MDIKLILNDTTDIPLPPTLMVNGLMNEADYELHRAPFSSIQVVAGDGIAKAGPLTIAGKAYFRCSSTRRVFRDTGTRC
jgi:hypothetical protein